MRTSLIWLTRAVLLAALALSARPLSAMAGPPLEEHASRDGVLNVTLVAEERDVAFDGVRFPGMIYNGRYEGPVLRVQPGDTMRIHLVNRLKQPTNLHFHGIETTPRGNSDNIAILVPPGTSFDYAVPVPADQPPGLYWYHAHVHGLSEAQVMGGLSGAIIVEGSDKRIAGLAGVQDRVLVLKDYTVEDSEDPLIDEELHGVIQSVNGRRLLDLTMAPGETQLWRIGNHSSNMLFHLRLAGHRFRVISEDGGLLRSEVTEEVLHLRQGSRMEVLVQAGAEGDYDIVSEHVLTGDKRERAIGRLHVRGHPATAAAIPPVGAESPDLRLLQVTEHRTIVFSQEDDESRFYIDGKTYDHARTDLTVRHGSVESWTIRNDSQAIHTFHIHQLHFQVTAINGAPVPFTGHVDTVRVPEGGSVTIVIPFTGPMMVGKFLYHCHVLRHEDRGMMASIEVTDETVWSWLDGLYRQIDLLIRQASLVYFALVNGMPLSWCGF